MPRKSQSIIQDIIISKNNVEIQRIQEFNLIYNILNDTISEEDKVDSERINTTMTSTMDNNHIVDKDYGFFANTDEPKKYKYFIDGFLGFISEGRKVIDLRNTNINITIKLAPKYITYRGIQPNATPVVNSILFDETSYHYRLTNKFSTITILSSGDNINNSITFTDYKIVKGINGIDKNIHLIHTFKGKIKYIIGTFMDANKNTDSGLQLSKHNADVPTFKSSVERILPRQFSRF
jgi:hypothetical protein